MTTPNQLLVTLQDAPCTAAAAAARVGVPVLVAEAMLQRLQKEGLTQSIPAGSVLIWTLQPAGAETAIALKKHAA